MPIELIVTLGAVLSLVCIMFCAVAMTERNFGTAMVAAAVPMFLWGWVFLSGKAGWRDTPTKDRYAVCTVSFPGKGTVDVALIDGELVNVSKRLGISGGRVLVRTQYQSALGIVWKPTLYELESVE